MADMGNKRKHSSRRASFLKVLDEDFSKKLTIPRAFIKNFDGDIPHWFVLEIFGTRKCWRVDTREDENGGFYFGYGWDEFVEEQSLQIGDFLLFGYEEPLILEVKIFEKDGTEKTAGTNIELEYEVEGSEFRRQGPKTHHVEQEDMWSTRPSFAKRCEEIEKSQEFIDEIERRKAYECGIEEGRHDLINQFELETAYGYGAPEQQHGANDITVPEADDQSRVHEKQLENSDRIERKAAKLSATEEGVCFTLTWRKTHHMYYYLTFPRAMISGKKCSSDETVILQDKEGNTWPMKLRARHGGRVDLAKGWKEFLIETDVRDGDILTFEFVSDKVIQIDIERVTQIDPPSERVKKNEPLASFPTTYEEPAVNYTTINYSVPETKGETESFFGDFTSSSFSTTWKDYAKRSHLHIPSAIARQQKLENQDTVILYDPEGKQWPIKVRTRPSDGRVGLAQGWSAFWRQHRISIGDTMIFEFVSDHVMKVNIIRAVQVLHAPDAGPAMKREVMQLD